MIRNPLVIEYCPRTEFYPLSYSDAFDKHKHSYSTSLTRRIPFYYQTCEPIETDIFRKHFAVTPTSSTILEQYKSLFPHLARRYIHTQTPFGVYKTPYSTDSDYPYEDNGDNLANAWNARGGHPISYRLIQWKRDIVAKLIDYWYECMDYIEMDMYICIAKAQTRLHQSTTNTPTTVQTIARMFPRVYQYNLMTRYPYVDSEALVDMILYTPYLYQTKQHCIQNQSSSYIVYTEEGKMIPYHEAIQYGIYRPNMYWNKKDNIGWRQSYDKTRKRFQTICFTRKTYDLFIDNMRDTIRWFHANKLVYLDWNVRNIGYSEVDCRFKVFDFDAMARVVSGASDSSSLIQQMRPRPECRSFHAIYKDYMKSPRKYVSSTRRTPLTPYELDWNLFYTMVNELIVVG